MTSIAVITGSNQGIGLALVKALYKVFEGKIYLTARNSDAGLKAVKLLEEEGIKVGFHQLDVTDQKSIARFASYLLNSYGGLNILVNNAAIAYKLDSAVPFGEQAEETLRTNYWGLLAVCEQLFPLLRPCARVINVGSLAGKWAFDKCSEERRNQLLACKSADELGCLMKEFVENAKENTHKQQGWANSAYGMSKMAVIILSKIQQYDVDQDQTRPDIVINSVSPGYVSTSMTSYKGTLSPEEVTVEDR